MKKFLIFCAAVLAACAVCMPAFAEIPLGSVSFSESDTEKTRGIKKDYNKAYLTYFSVIASSAAYAPKGEGAAYLKNYGWDISVQQASRDKWDVHFIQAKNHMSDGTNLYLLSFRGSVNKKDWTADLTAGQVIYGGKTLEESEKIAKGKAERTEDMDAAVLKKAAKKQNKSPEKEVDENAENKNLPKVHKGFNVYADAVLHHLLDDGKSEFLKQFRADRNARLLLTGHSLGGAVATLVGQRLIDYGFDPQRLQVITFGAPAVANKPFKQKYGNRMNLIRVTNTADPIPLTLQALLRTYKQFGEEVRFRIPGTTSNMTHIMNLYLDAGLRNYYQSLDKGVKQGALQDWPDLLLSESGKPLVLICVKEGKEDKKKKTEPMAMLQRFMLNEYKALFPNYSVYYTDDPWKEMEDRQADYLLVLEFDANPSREDRSWFLTLSQTLSDKDGVIAAGSVARRTSPEAGNIRAAMKAVRLQREELLKQTDWLRPGSVQVPGKFTEAEAANR